MRNWTIGKRLTFGFGAVVAIVAVLGVYSVSQLRAIQSASDRVVNDSLPGTALSWRILVQVKNNLSFTLEHLAASDPSEMATIEANVAKTREQITADLKKYETTITQPEDRALFDKVKPARENFVATFSQTIALSRSGKKDEAAQLFASQVKPAYQGLENAVAAVSEWNVHAGEDAGAVVARAVSSTITGVLSGVAMAVIMAVVVGLFIIRSTGSVLRAAVTSLRQGAEQVASASGQVATASQSLSQGATEQAASLEETSASMEEMASMTRQNSENTKQAAVLMQTVDGKVRDSNTSLNEMVASMSAIKESSDKISRIIKTIDEIAFQTNILALNAAVEAARAGEAGMGFAVVADEVRNLAQRSAQAARDTAVLIEESITRSTEGAARVELVGASIRSITESVAEVKGLVDGVSTASQQQTQGIEQVSQAVAQMEKVTQTTAATAEESAAASEELSSQAAQSMTVVEALAALVGGGAVAQKSAPAHTRPAGLTAQVVPLSGRKGKPSTTVNKNEELLPLESTGTYGSF